MTERVAPPAAPGRIATGVPGLDEVTGGGFIKSGVYILQGAPGAGKTILANQIVHHHAAAGGHVVYVTLLAESHGRLLQHMQGFEFFDAAALPEKVYYISAFNALRAGGLKGVVELLRTEMRSRRAGIVVLDGLVMAASAAQSDEALKVFISEIQAHATLTGCTTLLLASEHADRPVSAEQTMVDGILLLRERAYGPRRERNIEVVKFRGSGTLRGNHAFQIGPRGITIHPRLEAAHREPTGDAIKAQGLSTGVPALDAMWDIGGYARGGVTAVSGPSGSGKTTLALHYLAQASAREKGLFFGFYESPEMLARMAQVAGVGQRGGMHSHVEYLWQPFGENVLDALAAQLLDRVRQSRSARVVIDSAGGFMAAPAFAERGGPFFAALMNELRRLGATTLVTVEEDESAGDRLLGTPTMSALADSLVQLTVRNEGRVRRFAAIRKSRVARCDLRVRELVLTPSGLDFADEEQASAP
jgi:circadian clock protein KaiC